MARVKKHLAELQALIEATPFFSKTGEPIDYEFALADIEDWPGPEDPTVMPMGYWQQDVYDRHSDLPKAIEAFQQIRELTEANAKTNVPFIPDGDTWDWPNFAVAMVGWTAGLVAMHTVLQDSLPADLNRQWNWYLAGRLPCAYVAKDADAKAMFETFYSQGPPDEGFMAFFEEHPNEFVVY